MKARGEGEGRKGKGEGKEVERFVCLKLSDIYIYILVVV